MNRDTLGRSLLTNYAKIGWRSVIKNKLTLMVSVAGLVAGLTSSFFIGLFILDELAYDRHFQNHDRIYRITSSYDNDGHRYKSAQTQGDIADKLLNAMPEVQSATRLLPLDEGFILTDEGAFKEDIIYTDSSFLTVFGLDLLKGNKSQCLAGPSSVIISERAARKLFGNDWSRQEVLGKVISIDGRIPMAITAVFRALPDHTHFHSDLFASVPSGFESWMDEHSRVYTYARLDEKVDENSSSEKLRDLSAHFFDKEDQMHMTLTLQRLSDIYLFSSLEDENARQGNVQNIIALCLVTLFLMIITIVNFVNLYTAGSFSRLKEVGVRKTMGALQWQIRAQFFGETAIIAFISFTISFLLAALLLPAFNQLTDKAFLTSSLFKDKALLLIGSLTLITAFLAGSYPAIVLAGKNTIDSLKQRKNTGRRGHDIRKGLLVLQFSLSCVMVILSFVAFQQVNLISKKDLGFDRANTVAISNPYMLGSTESILDFRQELLKVTGVENISVTGYSPSQNRWENDRITFPDRNEFSPRRQHANWITVDENFINTMGIHLIEGRNFLQNLGYDKDAVIINQTAVSQFNLNAKGKNPVGSELSFHEEEKTEHFNVVGVVADFNFGSLHEKIGPVIMKPGYHRFEMIVRLSPKQRPLEILKAIESVWKKNLPLIPFQYSFVETRFDKLHESDIVASKLFSLFCLLTIVMSVLGLFSMVTYSVVSRTKELGIRKLLGASRSNITALVASDFLRLIFIAYVLAVPFAWIIASRWVNNFAYKTDITWWIFALTGLILIGISLMTLSYQTLKAARTNPVDHLRHE